MTETVVANLFDITSLATLTLAGDVTGVLNGTQVNTVIATNAVTYNKFQQVAAGSVVGNNTGSTANAQALTPSQVLDIVGNTQGMILYRGASGWATLAPGSAGFALVSNGAGANPSYASVVTLANQNANLVLAGPASGGAAAPTFRLMVLADLPVQSEIVSGYTGNQVLPANLRVFRFVSPTTITLPINLTGSFCSADVAATASATLTLKKAAAATPNTFSNIGTINFAASGVTATFTFSSAVTLNAGDVLVLDAQSSPDATLAGVAMSIRGTAAGF